MQYVINGTWNHGFVILRESTNFVVHPGITVLDVLCIGGGGGGFDPSLEEFKIVDSPGDGGNTSFGRYVTAGGGGGGSLILGN